MSKPLAVKAALLVVTAREEGRREGIKQACGEIRASLKAARKEFRGSWAGIPNAAGGKLLMKGGILSLQKLLTQISKIEPKP